METDWGIIAVMWWWTREDVVSSAHLPPRLSVSASAVEEILRGTGAWDKLLKNRFCTGNVFKAGGLEVLLLQTSATKRRNDASSSEQCKLVRAGFLVAVSKVWGSRVGLLGRIIWR